MYITGRRPDVLEQAAKETGATPIVADASRVEGPDVVTETVNAAHGKLDIYVANAGVAEVRPFDQVDKALYDRIMDANLKGLFFGTQSALTAMDKGGSIVLVATAMWPKGFPGYSVYTASKAAARSLARVFAAELAPKNIRVNVLSPGLIDTPIIEKQGIERNRVEQTFVPLVPLQRMGRPEEMAATALFLASDESSYVTGIDLMADGGVAQD